MPSSRPLISVRPLPDDHATLLEWARRWRCSASEATIRLAIAKAAELSPPAGLDTA
jgi:hypothetical protein